MVLALQNFWPCTYRVRSPLNRDHFELVRHGNQGIIIPGAANVRFQLFLPLSYQGA